MGGRFGRAFPPSSVLRQAEIPLGNTYVPYTTAGLWTYQIPSWVQSGHLIDIVGIGGGVGGLIGTGPANGGGPGTWGGQTFTYGTDIPGGTTTLYVLVGGGGAPQGTGTTSRVGYGLGTAPSFDAVGTYHSGAAVGSLTFSHTATAGACVLIAWTLGGTLSTLTYGGASPGATALGPISPGGSLVGLYAFLGVTGGSQNCVITGSGNITVGAIPVSYNNVSLVTQKFYTAATSSALSQTIITSPNCLTSQMFGGGTNTNAFSSPSGGTLRLSGSASGAESVIVNDTTSPGATFTATGAVGADAWGGLGITLAPSFSTSLITFAGGSAANTVNAGQAAGNETFPASGLASKTYIGGAAQSTDGVQGNSPGGGGPGGTATLLPGIGGDGAVFITARRS